MRFPASVLIVAFVFWHGIATSPAQEVGVSRELLLFREVPIVVTATGREQPLTQAPSAITLISAEEIRQLGATSLPDLFRSIPGLDFFRVSASNVSIGARGLNSQVLARMQVLVDGLSVYEDVLGLIYWHQIPIPLEEIERIEIVRSPATALYGDKAFAGVIHIITKSPEALRGTHFAGTAGDAGTGIGNLIHAGGEGKLRYKVAVGYDRTNQFPNPDFGRTDAQLGRLDQRGHFQIDYTLAEASNLSFTGGVDEFDRREIVLAGGAPPAAVSGGMGFLRANYTWGDLKAQVSYNRFDAEVRSNLFLEDTAALANVYQAQLQHGLSLGARQVLLGGASYRFMTFDSPGFIGASRDQQLFSVFLQHEWSIREQLTLTTGLGVGAHPEAGLAAAPRASLVYSPWRDQTFRVSVARALRDPSFLENFERLPLIVVPASPTTPPQTLTVLGNPNLKPEEMLSYELGYQTFLFDRLRVRFDLFYNQLDDVIAARPVFTTINPRRPPVQTGVQFINGEGGDIYGGEVAIDLFVTDWLKGFLNYSYQERIGAVARTDPTPHHKGNVGLLFSFANGLSATVLLHHVGEPEAPAPGVSPYTIVNARLGYRLQWFGRETELALQAFNLFDDVHREFPGGDLIERRVSGTLRARF